MATLERALEIASLAHGGVLDRNGQPYVLHPLRIMMKMQTMEQRIVAILHDVVEDSVPPQRWDLDGLRAEGFSEEIVAAVDHLSRREEESYEQFVARIRPHPLAVAVKLGDLEDNMDFRRLAHPMSEKDHDRMARYVAAYRLLTGRADEYRTKP